MAGSLTMDVDAFPVSSHHTPDYFREL